MNYIISIVDEIKPKNIITLIDNSPEFYELSNVFYNKGIKLIAIQNANRTTLINKKISNFFIPNYFTIGEFENKVFHFNLLNNLLGCEMFHDNNLRKSNEPINFP